MEILKAHRQIGNQLIGIVIDLRQIVDVFIIIRVIGFDAVDPGLQLLLQSMIILVGIENVLVRRGEGGRQNRMGSAAAHGSAGGKRSGNGSGYPTNQQNNQEHMGVLRRIAADPGDHRLRFLCGLFGIFRSLAGIVYPVSDLLCCRILLLNVPLLPPAGEGIGAGLGGLCLSRLIDGADIGLVCCPFQLCRLVIFVELLTVSMMPDGFHGGFGCFRGGIC